jgi:AraC-like DNA-binding protein
VNLNYLNQPSVPFAYAQQFLDLAEKRGLNPAKLLEALGVRLPVPAEARLSLRQIGVLLLKIVDNNRDDPIGYELGLTTSLTGHGFVGFGLMSQPNARAAISFGLKFSNLLTPHMLLEYLPAASGALLQVTPVIDLGSIRRQLLDYYLVSTWRIAEQLTGIKREDISLHFDYPEPTYFKDFRAQLPEVYFAADKNQMRGLDAVLDQPLPTSNPAAAELVAQQCERQLCQLKNTQADFLSKFRGAICAPAMGYADQTEVAARLNLSLRSLKRKLQQHDTSFRTELDAIRLADARQLLRDTSLSISLISERLGYTDPVNFTRAFRRLSANSPSEFRKQAQRTW